MAVDVKVYGVNFRIISAYAPHCGYGRGALQTFYSDLHNQLHGVRSSGRHVVIGGDFNTQVHAGWRSDVMKDFAAEHGLEILSDRLDVPWSKRWTFESTLGHRRQLDYILADSALTAQRAEAVRELDCGSDHRAVMASVTLPRKDQQRARRTKPNVRWQGSHSYQPAVTQLVETGDINSLRGVHECVKAAADSSGATKTGRATAGKAWDTAALRELRQKRRDCSDRHERARLSKTIATDTRRLLRKWQTERLTEQLSKFKELDQLHRINAEPVKKHTSQRPAPREFADVLQDVYSSSEQPHDLGDASLLAQIPEFDEIELRRALRQLSGGKCADKHGVVLEMIAKGGASLHNVLLGIFNQILRSGDLPDDWSELLFVMLPKPGSGDKADPNNWRPIAVLDVTYKVFSKMLNNRLKPILDSEQPSEQMGFRSKTGVDHALMVLECVIGQSIEWNVPVWIVSIDLKKAFDRVCYSSLFDALREQEVDESYLALLSRLYSGQSGNVGGQASFPICRGVRQGDILSPALFNAALESVLRRWKTRMGSCGLLLDSTHERLTNIRYADDLLLFGKTFDEAISMFEALSEELARAGLSINGSKTKMLTTDSESSDSNVPLLADAGECMVEILRCEATHKYLGRLFSGDLRRRGQCNLNHRLACGWMKFHNLAPTLLNRKIPVPLRLKLFHSVVTPAVCYSLSTTPLTSEQIGKLDAVQRKMLRKIVGWVRFDDEDWETTGRRMKARLEAALERHPVLEWSRARELARDRLLRTVDTGTAPLVAQLAANWVPSQVRDHLLQHAPHRRRGRPRQRWTD